MGGWFRSGDLFCAGLAASGAFLLNPSTELRFVQFLLFCLYCRLLGRKHNAPAALCVMLGIAAANLLTPHGRVLAEWGGFRLTQGALMGGLHKAVTLEGLLLISRASIRPGLRLPGAFGALLADCFCLLDLLASRKALLKPGRIIEGIDELLLELSAGEAAPREPPLEPPRTAKAVLVLLAAAAAPAALTVWAHLR
jgi:heptaprenyl diphosphate synthase